MPRHSVLFQDHPRIRGEHAVKFFVKNAGSGIIPAYAGSTALVIPPITASAGSSPHTRGARSRGCPARCRARDHPRIRGEHSRFSFVRCCGGGIIPAYAGSTLADPGAFEVSAGSSPHTRGALRWDVGGALDAEDHPRIRGEHPASLYVVVSKPGIIPAYAGSTSASRSSAM